MRVQWAGQAYKIYSSQKKTNFKEVSFSTMAFTAKTLSWRSRHLNIAGCLLKRGPTKGGLRAPQDPPPPPHSNWRQKRRGNDARMSFSLIYFFAPVSIFYILHNYVIPQTMPHAIPQTHSAIYPHRENLELYHMLNIAFENE